MILILGMIAACAAVGGVALYQLCRTEPNVEFVPVNQRPVSRICMDPSCYDDSEHLRHTNFPPRR